MDFMSGLERRTVKANGIGINLWIGGDGPPVLLHGWPQTAQMWHRIAPQPAKHYTVVCPDLRGYGDSDKPRDGYDKKTMARDLALRVRCPLLAIWGEFGKMHDLFDVLATWQEKADGVTGHPLPCAHFIPEEATEALLADLLTFLGA